MKSQFALHAIEGVGIGLRHPHLKEMEYIRPPIPWLEVHTENFFHSATPEAQLLKKIREYYALSAHCVGLSLGAAEGVDIEHLKQVQTFIEIYEPALVSDHCSWSRTKNAHAHDLLPLPYTKEALEVICRNIEQTQTFLKRQILIENPSSYVAAKQNDFGEAEFLREIVKRTECGLLLDVNNIYVTCHNHGLDAEAYLAEIPAHAVKEIHLAGHTSETLPNGDTVLIDTHGSHVIPEVWNLYGRALDRVGAIPTLIEWDTDVPELFVLVEEMQRADELMKQHCQAHHTRRAQA